MAIWDTIKSTGGNVLKEVAPIGVQLLEDELRRGKNDEPETRPDTQTAPIASTQQFENPKGIKIPKAAMIGGGAIALGLVAFLALRKK